MDAGEGEKKKAVSEEDAAEAVVMKNKANEFFKSIYDQNIVDSGLNTHSTSLLSNQQYI